MKRVVVFGFDAAESSQIRRIRSLIDIGYDVVAFTMRRRNMNPDFVPPWRNIHLYEVANEQLLRRVGVLFLSLFKIARHRAAIANADVLVARNFDLLLLAVAARALALRPRLPVIYECLDIHGSFTRPSRSAKLLRFVERLLLRRVQLLVVSSPGFVRNYFEPVQRYAGPIHLLENKIWFGEARPPRPRSPRLAEGARPIVVGWVGSLRCEPSFRILLDAARQLGDRVRIECHGNVHAHVLPDFEATVATHPNVRYHGPYPYPDGLAPVYSGCDLVWAQDLWQAGANSDWLLPNRIYEASYFGCLSIAVEGKETGRKVRDDDLGYTVPEATGAALARLLAGLDPADVEARRAALLARDERAFVYGSADVAAMIERAIASSSDIHGSSIRTPTS